MDQSGINKATDALVTAIKTEAVNSGKDIESDVSALAPGLSIGSNAPGGYNYQRNVAPVVPVLTKGLVVSAKQELLKGLIKEAIWNAQNKYEDAKYRYQARQRKFNQRQATKTRARYAASDAAQAAYVKSLSNTGNKTIASSRGPSGVVVSKSRPASGGKNYNPQGQTGNPMPRTYNPQQTGGSGLQGGSIRIQ